MAYLASCWYSPPHSVSGFFHHPFSSLFLPLRPPLLLLLIGSPFSLQPFCGFLLWPCYACFTSYLSTVFYFPCYYKPQFAFHTLALLHHIVTLLSSLITSPPTVSSCWQLVLPPQQHPPICGSPSMYITLTHPCHSRTLLFIKCILAECGIC